MSKWADHVRSIYPTRKEWMREVHRSGRERKRERIVETKERESLRGSKETGREMRKIERGLERRNWHTRPGRDGFFVHLVHVPMRPASTIHLNRNPDEAGKSCIQLTISLPCRFRLAVLGPLSRTSPVPITR